MPGKVKFCGISVDNTMIGMIQGGIKMLAEIKGSRGIFRNINRIAIKMAFAGDATTNYRLGKDYKRLRDMGEAIKCFKRAIKSEPHYADAYYELCDVLHQWGKLNESIKAFKTAADIYPNLINAHVNVGIAYSNREKFDEAIGEFEKAIRLQSNCADAHNKLGVEYRIAEKPVESESHYGMALKAKTDVAIIHSYISAVYEQQENYDKAISELIKAMKINPDIVSADMHSTLGNLYKKKGKTKEAEEQLEIAKLMKGQ
jgi:tetratricopeptide (TPR) repeat protein